MTKFIISLLLMQWDTDGRRCVLMSIVDKDTVCVVAMEVRLIVRFSTWSPEHAARGDYAVFVMNKCREDSFFFESFRLPL
jgi:hypothetical protein